MPSVLLSLLIVISLQAGEKAKSFDDLPPALPDNMKSTPSSCKVPPFLVHLPPGMQEDYKSCVNDTFKPTKLKAQSFLKYEFNKNAEFVSLEAASEFYTRVYRLKYKLNGKVQALICNEKINYCLKDEPVGKKHKKEK